MSGLFIPLFYFQQFAAVSGGVDSPFLVEYSLAIVNAAATVSRIIVGVAGDVYGPLNTSIPVSAVAGILAYSMFVNRFLYPYVCHRCSCSF
jgi:hypothetical protein